MISTSNYLNNSSALSSDIIWLNGVCSIELENSQHGTGALLYNRSYILTAAHLFDELLTQPTGSDYVVNSSDYTVIFNVNGQIIEIDTVNAYIHKDYDSMSYINDIALIKLAEPVPDSINDYDLYDFTDEAGKTFVKSGFGYGGEGNTGYNELESYSLQRYGLNIFDGTGIMVESKIAGEYGSSESLFYDFDDGDSAHDFFYQNFNIHPIDLADQEVNIAPGDSGGPGFISGKLASITSTNMTYNFTPDLTAYGYVNTDVTPELDSSFGEIARDIRVSQYINWIEGYIGEADDTALLGYDNGVDINWYLEEKLAQLRTADPNTWNSRLTEDLSAILFEAGFTASEHYHQYGWQEGLNPNRYFDSEEYVGLKVQDLNDNQVQGKTDWTITDFINAWGNRDPYEHFRLYGLQEDIDPSNCFDTSVYIQDKTAISAGWDFDTIRQAFIDYGLSAIDHYYTYGINEDLTVTEVTLSGVIDYSVLGELSIL